MQEKECPQLKLARIDGSLFFGAVPHVRESIANFYQRNPEQKHLLIVAIGINFVDLAGAEYLEEEAIKRRKIGGTMSMYLVKEDVVDRLQRGGYLEHIGRDNIYGSKTEAVKSIFDKHLDKSICAKCSKRVFLECDSVPRD